MVSVYFLLLLFGGARISDQKTSSIPSSSSSTFLEFDPWSNGTTSGSTHRNQRTWPVAKIHRIFNESNQTCFGTILSDRFILTAADCLRAPVDSVAGTQLQLQVVATVGPLFNVPLTGTAIIHETHSVDVALFRLDHPLDNSRINNWSPPLDGSILEPNVENCFVLGPNFTFIPLMIFSQNQWPYKHRWTHSSVVSFHGKWIGPNGPIDIGYKIYDRLLANFEYCSRDSIFTQPQPDGTVSFGGPLICRLGSSTSSSPSKYHLFGVTIFSGPLNHTSHLESNQQRHLYFFKLSHCFRWLMASMKRNQ